MERICVYLCGFLCVCVYVCLCVSECVFAGGMERVGLFDGWVNLRPLVCADDSIDLVKIMWRSGYVVSVWSALILIHCLSFHCRYITARSTWIMIETLNTTTEALSNSNSVSGKMNRWLLNLNMIRPISVLCGGHFIWSFFIHVILHSSSFPLKSR